MRRRLAALAFCILSPVPATMAQSQGPADIVPFPDDKTAPQKTSEASDLNTYTLETPLEIIAADPAAAAVVEKDIPGLLGDSHFSMIEGMGLKDIAALSRGEMTPQMLAQTEADLKLIPRKPREACKKLHTQSNVLLGERRVPVVETEC